VIELLQANDVCICCPDLLQDEWQPVLPHQAADWHLQHEQAVVGTLAIAGASMLLLPRWHIHEQHPYTFADTSGASSSAEHSCCLSAFKYLTPHFEEVPALSKTIGLQKTAQYQHIRQVTMP
jgi:hypothetical protein